MSQNHQQAAQEVQDQGEEDDGIPAVYLTDPAEMLKPWPMPNPKTLSRTSRDTYSPWIS